MAEHRPSALELDVFDLLPCAVYVCEAPSGKIRRFNKRAAELWRREPRIDDPAECICGSKRVFLPDGTHVPFSETPMAAALEHGTVTIDREVVMERHDGTRFTASVNIAPLRAPDGTITGAVNVFQDITERKRTDLLIRGQTLALEMIAQDAPLTSVLEALVRIVERQSDDGTVAGILLLDADGRHLVHGAAPSLPESYNQSVNGLAIAPDVGTCAIAAYTGRPVVTEDIETSPSWQAFKHLPLSLGLRAVWSMPILSASGKVLGTFGTYFRERRGPTAEERRTVELLVRTAAIAIERQRAEEAKRLANRRKDEFLAMLAHELRNPLAPIRTAAELLGIGGSDPIIVRRAHEVIDRQVRNMARLLDDLLDVSRITRGAIELRRQPVALGQIAARAVDTVHPFIQARKHELITRIAEAPIVVEGDEMRLEQVLVNLLSNAAKYTDPGGRIELIVTADDRVAEMRVRDNGRGISAELLPHVFELFTQGDHVAEHGHQGLGVGLTIVQHLIEKHGGHIRAHSEGMGRGSEFVIRLPRIGAAH